MLTYTQVWLAPTAVESDVRSMLIFVLASSFLFLVQLHIQKEAGNLTDTSHDYARTWNATSQKHDI